MSSMALLQGRVVEGELQLLLRRGGAEGSNKAKHMSGDNSDDNQQHQQAMVAGTDIRGQTKW